MHKALGKGEGGQKQQTPTWLLGKWPWCVKLPKNLTDQHWGCLSCRYRTPGHCGGTGGVETLGTGPSLCPCSLHNRNLRVTSRMQLVQGCGMGWWDTSSITLLQFIHNAIDEVDAGAQL